MLRPRSVALVGISRRGGFASDALRHLEDGSFSGPIYLVNPKYDEFGGRVCHRTLVDIPGVVDLALIFVPASVVPEVIEDCGRSGVRAAIIYSSGFAEEGPEGAELQQRTAEVARTYGVRILGPNCQGLFYEPGGLVAAFSPAFATERPPSSGVAYVGQSGAIGGSVLAHANARGVGLVAWASVGNQIDVSVVELAERILREDEVRTVALYLEAIPDGVAWSQLLETARQLGKHLVLLRAGKSQAGQLAAASHTGAMVKPDQAFTLLAERYGVIAVDDVDELIDVIEALSLDARPTGRSVAVITSSGGAGGMSADQIVDAGLNLTVLSSNTRTALAEVIPAYGSIANPVDVTAQLFAHQNDGLEQACTLVANDTGVAVCLVILTGASGALGDWAAHSIARAAHRSPNTRFVVSWLVPQPAIGTAADVLRTNGVFMTGSIRSAVRLIKRLAAASSTSSQECETVQPPVPPTVVDALLSSAGIVTEARASVLLDSTGVSRPASRLVHSREEAESAAKEIGGDRFVLKIQSAQIAHKSDIGGVKVGVGTQDVATAFDDVFGAGARIPGAALDGVLVQEMVGRSGDYSAEIIVGIQGARDGYPPVVTVGFGGVTAELYGDVASALVPLSLEGAQALIGSLRSAPLLSGFRGRPALDSGALANVLVGLSGAAACLGPRLAELEVNPLRVMERGAVALDILARIDNGDEVTT
ncbi:acetate--CoA ligase family protein [Paenarthrobacter sp. NEAU-H11]|uniref:acetate--CoA ligase family protein n=1 Tax=Paenarthrobacter sp. NEAU-H11 TaxID=3423924 RepID=UPI003D343B35